MHLTSLRFLGRSAAVVALAALAVPPLAAEEAKANLLEKPIPLVKPSVKRGSSVMEALAMRASVREWDARDLAPQDLADLLWAANGVNRPASGKRTAPSAMNAQDVDVYVFTREGAYLYDARAHALKPVASGDARAEVAELGSDKTATGTTPALPPVVLVLVSDMSRFNYGDAALKAEWAALDSGIVSENVALFCASAGLATVPRADMNVKVIGKVLKLKTTQRPLLNLPVGYPVKR